jgi:uncharacterized protein YndB with AHSA1/START domain
MTPQPAKPPTVRLERIISAPPEQVYRAWLDPEVLRRWMAPGELQVTRVEVDGRVGGHYRVWQGTDEDAAGGFECEILELDPVHRIVFRWGFVGPARTDGPVFDSLLTVTLTEERGGSTSLTLVHEQLDALWSAMPPVADNVGTGWGMVLDRLASLLGATTGP